MRKLVRLGVLVSGGGRTLENILKHIRAGSLKGLPCSREFLSLQGLAEVAVVIASRPGIRGIEIAEETNERGQHPTRLGAVDGLNRLPRRVIRGGRHAHIGRMGRTSTLPMRADGMRAATWMASFRSRASMR